MKRSAFLFALALVSGTTIGQGLVSIYDEDGNQVNGSLVSYAGSPDDLRDTVSLATVIVGATSRDVMVRRYETWPLAGSRNFFCWGVCYTAVNAGDYPTLVSPLPETLTEDEYYRGFHAYYEPNGTAGTARFRYVWYDAATPNGPDSSWVDIQFGGTVGLAEATADAASLGVRPNPSNGNDVLLDYTLDRLVPGTSVVVYTVLGERVRTLPVSMVQGRIVLGTADLVDGVYFASVESNGRTLATRRVVVTR
jgi:hypothetical protein